MYWISQLLLVLSVSVAVGAATLHCSSHQLQTLLGDYSQTCAAAFGEVLTLSAEFSEGLHSLNRSTSRLAAAVQQVGELTN